MHSVYYFKDRDGRSAESTIPLISSRNSCWSCTNAGMFVATHAVTVMVVPETPGWRSDVSDQGNHSQHMRHGVYYFKDRDSRPPESTNTWVAQCYVFGACVDCDGRDRDEAWCGHPCEGVPGIEAGLVHVRRGARARLWLWLWLRGCDCERTR